MSSVRGPNDKEERKASWLQKQGHARSIQNVMTDIAGHEIEDIVAYGAQLAIENSIQNGLTIDLVDLVNQHMEWQNAFV